MRDYKCHSALCGKSLGEPPELDANITVLGKLDAGISKRLLNPVAAGGARVGAPRLEAPQDQHADASAVGKLFLSPI